MKLARIEAIPKRVEFIRLADGRFATKPGIDLDRFFGNLLDIRDHILRGCALPDHYYRKEYRPGLPSRDA